MAPTFNPGTGRPLRTAMTSPPCVSVSNALSRRAALDRTHRPRWSAPPSARLQPSPTSRPGPAQGTPGHWWCRPLTKEGHPFCRRAQDGVDLDEQRDFLGQRVQTNPRATIWNFAAHRRRRARPRHQHWLTNRQHLTGQSGVRGLQSVELVGLIPIPENRAIRQHGRHLPNHRSLATWPCNLCLKTHVLYNASHGSDKNLRRFFRKISALRGVRSNPPGGGARLATRRPIAATPLDSWAPTALGRRVGVPRRRSRRPWHRRRPAPTPGGKGRR
jgi:hypothetical protein